MLECARQLLDRRVLRWPDALQLSAALVARDMFQGTDIIFVSSSKVLLDAAKAEGLQVVNPTVDAEAMKEPAKEAEPV